MKVISLKQRTFNNRIRHVHEPRTHLLATLAKRSERQKSTKFCLKIKIYEENKMMIVKIPRNLRATLNI